MKTKILTILLLAASVAVGFNKPNWPLEVISWDIDKAYPNLEYNYRLGVIGGVYPYRFYLEVAPTGMTIDSVTGVIRWTPTEESQDNDVSVKIYNEGRTDSLTHSYQVDVEIDAFRFVATTGNNGNNGSVSSPYATMTYVGANVDSSKYCYVRSGAYNEALICGGTHCARFMSYPNETVNFVATGSNIAVNGGGKVLFQGVNFDANNFRRLFDMTTSTHSAIFRNNIMANCYSTAYDNPAFLFFVDVMQSCHGCGAHTNFVVQNNVFHNIVSPVNHAAALTMYDVQSSVIEDNEVYDIDGSGFSDKDDGFKNTFRNNSVHDCPIGINLGTQYTQDSVDVSYNTIHDCDLSIRLGSQPGYLRNVWVYRNTLTSAIAINKGDAEEPYNINIDKNVIERAQLAYNLPFTDNVFADWVLNQSDAKVSIDSNIIKCDTVMLAGYTWGPTPLTWGDWKSKNFDAHSNIVFKSQLNSSYRLDTSNMYFGAYGSDIGRSTYAPAVYIDTSSYAYIFKEYTTGERSRGIKITVKDHAPTDIKYYLKRNGTYIDSTRVLKNAQSDTVYFTGSCLGCSITEVTK